ncbi:hypothetical protein Tco_1496454, partial [Tanacetum coccineum]
MYRRPSEPSRQEEFKHIVMNFIFDQEERITQLEDYMQVIAEEFMEFSSDVTRRLKEQIHENKNKPRKIRKSKSIRTPRSWRTAMSKRDRSTRGQASSSGEETMEEKVRKFGLFDNENHQMNYNNLVGRSIHSGDVVDWVFLSNKGINHYTCVTFRLGGVEREISLLELGWRVDLYSEGEFRDVATLSGLRG